MGNRRRVEMCRAGVCSMLWLLVVPTLVHGQLPKTLIRNGEIDGAATSRHVVVDRSALAADRLRIELAPGEMIEVVRGGQVARSGRTSWWGTVMTNDTGQPGWRPAGHAAFGAAGEVVVGTVFTDAGIYSLQVEATSGAPRWTRVDPRGFAPCDHSDEPGALHPPGSHQGTLAGSDGAPQKGAAPAGDPPGRIDIMVLYTPEARVGAGGGPAIEATAAAAVASTNLTLANSGSTTRLLLVHTEEAAYNDAGLLVNDLQWVRNHPSVLGLRDAHRADLVAMLVEDGGGFCGRAYVQRNPGPGFADDAFSVTARSCAVDNLSFAHEVGHNQGCEHDPAFGAAPDQASFPWSFGHVAPGTFRTVMAYSSSCGDAGCPRKPLYSSPDLEYEGLPAGIAGQRDNARTVEATAGIVASFQPRADLLFWDDVEGGTFDGWDGLVEN